MYARHSYGWGWQARPRQSWTKSAKVELYRDDRLGWGTALAIGHVSFHTVWQLNETTIRLALQGDNYEVLFTIEYKSKALSELEDKLLDKKVLDDLW